MESCDEVRDWLARHEGHCPVCGYNLHQLIGSRCPECEAPVRLGLVAPRPRVFWAVLALTPCMFSGIAAVLLLGGLVLTWFYRGHPGPWYLWATDVFGLFSGLIGVGLILACEHGPVINWRWPRQAAVAAGLWAVHLGAFGLLVRVWW